MVRLTEAQAKAFYAVHKDRPFYGDLVKFMTEGPVVVQVLEGEDAIAKNRQVMGATNPEKADAGTIRKEFATNIERNAVHGSDAPETAKEEIAFFFSTAELASLRATLATLARVRPLGLDDPPTGVFLDPCREHAKRLRDFGAVAVGVGEVDVRGSPAAALAERADLHRIVEVDARAGCGRRSSGSRRRPSGARPARCRS